MKNSFKEYHPVTGLVYFMIVILFTMFVLHPVLILISAFSSSLYVISIKGIKYFLKSLKYMIVMILMVIIINPLFNHEGQTIIRYFGNGNPLTLESILYGIFMAFMLMAVINWFTAYNEVMTNDKFIFLFGRIIPHLSLVLSMTIRYVPRFKEQFGKIREARKSIGKDITDGGICTRIKNTVDIISIMLSWSFENSVETSESMQARGYGLSGRTSFSIYRLTFRDLMVVFLLILMALLNILFIKSGNLYYRYYPTFENELFGIKMIIAYIIYGIMCIIPIIINILEEARWNYLVSKI